LRNSGKKITFCKRELEKFNYGKTYNGKMYGPYKNHTEISMKDYIKLLNLPIREDLHDAIKKGVEKAEANALQAKQQNKNQM
jgi:hypothetical protein